jgi:uroporphyrinogen-III synthase
VADTFYRVVCTRKLDDKWKELALQKGIILESYDFLEIKPKAPETFQQAIEQNSAPFVFTSAHAVKAVAALLAAHPDILKTNDCFCIEGTTRNEAADVGFHIVKAAKDAKTLAQCIIDAGVRRVLHCSSLNRRQELTETLAAAGIEAEFCAVYEKALSPVKVGALDGVAFFSPSQVDAFLSANSLDQTTPAFCIGETTAAHLEALGHDNIHIAPQSGTESTLQTVFEHFKQA